MQKLQLNDNICEFGETNDDGEVVNQSGRVEFSTLLRSFLELSRQQGYSKEEVMKALTDEEFLLSVETYWEDKPL